MIDLDPLKPMAPLVFTPDARRFLALALLQGGDERVLPDPDHDDASMIMAFLANLGLLKLVGGGYVATDMLRTQVWAEELRRDPFPD
jgi:hypothetical protein